MCISEVYRTLPKFADARKWCAREYFNFFKVSYTSRLDSISLCKPSETIDHIIKYIFAENGGNTKKNSRQFFELKSQKEWRGNFSEVDILGIPRNTNKHRHCLSCMWSILSDFLQLWSLSMDSMLLLCMCLCVLGGGSKYGLSNCYVSILCFILYIY